MGSWTTKQGFPRPSKDFTVHIGGALDREYVQPQVISFMNRNLDMTYCLNWPAFWRSCAGLICLPIFLFIVLLVLMLFGVIFIPAFHGF